ncbi:Efflux pump periplasmic linker BepD precursor [Rubripirellula lacrimiformis]|uniref:Efflux pump periplasmic linker BepD n=1 Tax=Rubripirellula lacrimiformis TaxID=1930273 RepID=A0A517N4D5_9BACT|nr:efflux RND transporter periplasmic adaptor subunit [Rubripirellula lacrimiformis]QDT01868.1 Efflux pump periplasmic linker BepD precursor [Rubripirellula lacrimiformis]
MKPLPLPTLVIVLIGSVLLPACDQASVLKEQYFSSTAEAHEIAQHGDPKHGDGEHSAEAHGDHGHDGGEHAGSQHEGAAHESGEHALHKIVVTNPLAKDVVTTQPYVSQIHSWRHIEVRALEGGYLEKIAVQEGQTVNKGDVIFQILPTLYQARLDAELAEAQLAQIELQNTQKLFQQNIVSQPEVALANAKLAKVLAQVKLTQAELDFATIKAPFGGIVDKQHEQLGSLIAEGDVLTTLSDNSTMWVYFNVPEARYLAYEADPNKDDVKVELMLADGNKFPYAGKIGAVEADFNNETGNIAFRGDFPNPQRLLRHGQTGTVLLSRVAKGAVVIPQRATFEILAKKYAYVVDDDNIVHQREIVIQSEQDDIFLIKEGLHPSDKIVLEGIRQVRDGEKVEYEYEAPQDVLAHLKYHAE